MTRDVKAVIPPQDEAEMEQLGRLAEAVSGASEIIVGPDGQRMKLPRAVQDMLVGVLTTLKEGQAVTFGASFRRVSTQEAAEMLGISRPTLVGLLEAGRIPYEQPGTHRRIRLEDVIAFRDEQRRVRSAALDELVAETQALGLYDDDEGET